MILAISAREFTLMIIQLNIIIKTTSGHIIHLLYNVLAFLIQIFCDLWRVAVINQQKHLLLVCSN